MNNKNLVNYQAIKIIIIIIINYTIKHKITTSIIYQITTAKTLIIYLFHHQISTQEINPRIIKLPSQIEEIQIKINPIIFNLIIGRSLNLKVHNKDLNNNQKDLNVNFIN
jgi:hypothetical protein